MLYNPLLELLTATQLCAVRNFNTYDVCYSIDLSRTEMVKGIRRIAQTSRSPSDIM
jgi:hypothetical protein